MAQTAKSATCASCARVPAQRGGSPHQDCSGATEAAVASSQARATNPAASAAGWRPSQLRIASPSSHVLRRQGRCANQSASAAVKDASSTMKVTVCFGSSNASYDQRWKVMGTSSASASQPASSALPGDKFPVIPGRLGAIVLEGKYDFRTAETRLQKRW